MTAIEKIGSNSPMREVLEIFPSAQRVLFRKYYFSGRNYSLTVFNPVRMMRSMSCG